jgi:hypothetical protein
VIFLVSGDAATCHELGSRYGDAVHLFVAHSCDHALQSPPQLVVRLRQPIDTARFRNLGPPRPMARRALVLSNYVRGPRAELIERACRASEIGVSWAGTTTPTTATPEHAIANPDLVIALGRSVLEGMAAGRAVYVYGVVGGDGWLTPDRYPVMEADGFAGLSNR